MAQGFVICSVPNDCHETEEKKMKEMVTNGHQEMIIMIVDHIKYKQDEWKKKYIVTKEVKISVPRPTLTHEIKKFSP